MLPSLSLMAILVCVYPGVYWHKLQSITSCGRLRIAKHDTNLFTQLIDKDAAATGTAYRTCEFTHGLRHQSCL